MSETILAGLNDHQREAVQAPPGPVLVLAGPGSGKCVLPSTRLVVNDELVTAEQLWERYHTSPVFDGEGWVARPSQALRIDTFNERSGAFEQGQIVALYRQQVREQLRIIKFRDGSTIGTTLAHKFFDGLRWTSDVQPGAILALPRTLPQREQYLDPEVASLLGRQARQRLQQADQQVPDCVMSADAEGVAEFLQALFELEGGDVPPGNQIGLSIASPGMAEEIRHLLLRFGIQTQIRTGKKSSVTVSGPALELFGERLDRSLALTPAATQSGPHPGATRHPSPALQERGLVLNHAARDDGYLLQSACSAGEGLRTPLQRRRTFTTLSQPALQERALVLQTNTSAIAHMANISIAGPQPDIDATTQILGGQGAMPPRSPSLRRGEGGGENPLRGALRYEEIDSVELVDYEGWVYDLTVEGTHNFVAEGVLCHNTKVLTNRIAHLISEAGANPGQILAVTFTNKAAKEMRERLEKLIGPELAERVTMGTFHSVCARFLRRDIVHLKRSQQNPEQARKFVVYDSDDQLQLMRQVLKELRLDEKQYPPRQVLSKISGAKNELVNVAEYSRYARTYYEEVVTRCYERYQAKLIASNALDFDDLLVEMVRLFAEQPEVLAKYHKRYLHLLVDEYQDTNRAQYTLIKQLASASRNLFVVGDEAQAIYGWRGADIRNILQFEDDFPEARVILLEQNYRSTQPILDVAQAIIKASRQRKHNKVIWSERKEGLRVRLIEAYDEGEEARVVVDEIDRLRSTAGYTLNDFAVMYRTNAQSRALEEAFISRGVNYRLIGGTRFYERKEIKDILAYLRLIHNPYDTVSLDRVINVPNRGIGDKTKEQLFQWASAQGLPPYTALQLLLSEEEQGEQLAATAPFAGRQRTALGSFVGLIDELILARDQLPLQDLLDMALERVNYHEALVREHGPDEGEERWENVLELRAVTHEYLNFPREAQLPQFLEEVALIADVDTLDQRRERDRDAVTLITLHQAKGLEYPAVFLVGLEEGLLPHSRSTSEAEQLEEERRLFYVGATRAKERLYLLHAFRRALWGRFENTTPSRFLGDIPNPLLERGPARPVETVSQSSFFTGRGMSAGQQPSMRRRGRSVTASADRAPRQQPLPIVGRSAEFFAGQKVRHAQFGEGTVVTSRVLEEDEEVTVAFPGQGVKRLLATFARLEKLG